MKYFSLIILGVIVLFTSCEEGSILIETDISGRQVTLLAPGNGVEVSTNVVFFDWETVDDATAYEIQVARPDFDNTEQLFVNTRDSITSSQAELPIGSYQWRVRATNSNSQTQYATASFSVVPAQNFSDNVVILTSPENGLITNVVTQQLDWQEVTDASLYRLQILNNGTIVNEQTTTETNFPIEFPEGTLSWQVRAEKNGEVTGYSTRDILVDITEPNTPSLTSPADGTELNMQTVTFEWSRTPIEGSEEVDMISIYRDKALTDLVLSQEVSSPFETMLDNDTYYWIIQATDAAGNEGPVSSIFSFTVNEI